MKIVADAHIPFVAECFSSFGEVVIIPPQKITPDIASDADVLLVRALTPVNAKLLNGSRIKFVGTATTGVNHIDQQYLRDKGVGFASAPGANADAVADYVVAALLAFANKYNIQLKGKSIGIIGVGRIGSRVEKRVRALDMHVCLNDPPLKKKTGDAKYLPIEELYQCEFITIHTPLTLDGTDKTLHLADANFFNSLNNKTLVINTSRGEVIDTSALKQAVSSGKLLGAVIDVWENEPNIDTQLLQMVDLATPHIAGLSLDGRAGGMFMVYKRACQYFKLKVLKKLDDFLPPPSIPEIKVDDKCSDEQELFSQIVQQVYAIEKDDYELKKIVTLPENKQGMYFDNSRDNYPIRRNFHNTHITLEQPTDLLATKIKGIGFKINEG
jgi:erythronate-4-phosphate dehydrogenase